MKILCIFAILHILSYLESIQCQIVINELNLGDKYIELRNLGSTSFTFTGQNVKLYSYKLGSQLESSALLTGTIEGNGLIKYDINGAKKRRKKRSAGGSLSFSIGTDSSRYVFIYKAGDSSNMDSLIFKVSASGTSETIFTSASEWDNKYLLYSPGKVFVRIGNNADSPGDWEVRTVGTPDAPNGINGDPHFIQTVIDQQTNNTENVCYDVTGKSGDKIFILEDTFTNTKVFGILLNDYYMHSIEITHQQRTFSIKIHEILLNNGKKISWKLNNNHFEEFGKDFHLSILGSSIYLKLKHDTDDELNIKIFRKENHLVGKYLDIGFDNIIPNGKRYDGLLGHVGHQSMAFINPIQNEKLGFIKINKLFIKAERVIRNKIKCWLIKFEDAIAPKVTKDFIN